MNKQRLLIIHHGTLGDVITTFPALLRLRRSFGNIDALLRDELGKLAAELKVVDRWFALEAAAFASLYAESIDPAVKSLLCAYGSIVLFSFSRKLQETINKITEKKIHLIPPRPDVDQNIHVTSHIAANLAKRGMIDDTDNDLDSLFFSKVFSGRRDRRYDAAKVYLHPGSGSRKKNWAAANFIETAAILMSNGYTPEFILGPAEHFMAESLQAQADDKIKIRIFDDLLELTSLLKKAGGFIGNDSGISHLAAFLGLPTVAVFGPSDPQRWKPVGRFVKTVRPGLDCRPCFEKGDVNCETTECLHSTTPAMVIDAFYRTAGKRG